MENGQDAQPSSVTENQLHQVLNSVFSSLASQNPSAFDVLLTKVREEFFDTRQTRRPLSLLAKQLLETISVEEEDNADQRN